MNISMATAERTSTERLAVARDGRNSVQELPWDSAIDGWLFQPKGDVHPQIVQLPRPILLHVGRVDSESNLEPFLTCEVPGSKIVLGDGPECETLRSRFPGAHFLGQLAEVERSAAYRSADCVVVSNRADTFDLALLEALACGTPVAAYPAAELLGILGRDGRGANGDFPATIAALDNDLSIAISKALRLDRDACAVFGARLSRMIATHQFLAAWHNAEVRHVQATEEQRLETV